MSNATLIHRLCLPLLAAIFMTSLLGASSAQTPATSPSGDAKFQEFIKMLDDPDIRARLQAVATPPADGADTPPVSQIASWENAIRGHLAAMRNALPRIPAEAANAVRFVRAEINNRGFATIVVLFAALLAVGFGAEWLFKRFVGGGTRKPALDPLGDVNTAGDDTAARLFAELAPLAVFGLASAGAFLVFEWPQLLRIVILAYLAAVIVVRVALAFTRLLLVPADTAASPGGKGSLRLVQASDADVRFWYRRMAVFAGYLMAGWATVSLLPALGFSPDTTRLIAYLAGIGLVLLAAEIVWRRPGPTSRHRSITNWLLTAYLVVLWGLWVAGLNGLLWLGIYGLILPKALALTGQLAQSLVERHENAAPANPVRTVLITRGARAVVILLAALWLGLVLRLHPSALMENNETLTQIMRGVLRGIATLLVADLLWQVAKAYINRKLELSVADDALSPAEAARRSRLRTLLPIFRNMLAVFLAAVAVLMVLSELGVQIAPLIAGAGIFGVAIGFGSQTLVKDVLSGVFFMLDDAFRVGEYIESGSYKGTVESFSLRSVRLRHHRGPVFTVPFGSLGAVQNMSRDWVIDKFRIRVPFDTDIKKVKKLLKVIGAEMLKDPELAPQIIETVKMKGVEQFGDFGMELSFAFTAKPGHQSVVRRRAYTMIQQEFAANGINFAQPTVQVGSDDKQAATAAANVISLAQQKAAQAAQAEYT